MELGEALLSGKKMIPFRSPGDAMSIHDCHYSDKFLSVVIAVSMLHLTSYSLLGYANRAHYLYLCFARLYR